LEGTEDELLMQGSKLNSSEMSP